MFVLSCSESIPKGKEYMLLFQLCLDICLSRIHSKLFVLLNFGGGLQDTGHNLTKDLGTDHLCYNCDSLGHLKVLSA